MVKIRRRATTMLAVAALGISTMTGCSGSDDSATTDTTATAGDTAKTSTSGVEESFPRTVTDAKGEVTIDAKPQRVVSTSPSMTGTLLALGVPVVASAGAPVTDLTDGDGFFMQWAEIAHDRGVEVAYPRLDIDLDAVDSFSPDLIVGSVVGADAVNDEYAQLQDITTTVMVDYIDLSWQDQTRLLAEATGTEDKAEELIAEYERKVKEAAGKITAPPAPAIVAFYRAAEGLMVSGPDTQHGEILEDLGITAGDVDETVSQQTRPGIRTVSRENMAAALADVGSVFLMQTGTESPVAAFSEDPLVSTAPAVQKGDVYFFDEYAWRLDYYSALLTIDSIVEQLTR
ncbi:Fe2+-enterobactin ABC transporter substrate-binding protein [Corynebacterium sp. P5848]|uniref:Fe2+-enterobactin ABC transporter substrate-binding protein n=1 Tax=Corynebacterium marambiense TaxID=2765364 RepID=UPI002260C226|nr:Fe2+-enterobactin ABC transporter substrate-binding protein [Corynebacterium marambiense]MCX7543038.1 Fe2+-enterobactin ABC transporter substrate-binding protein [Corynebacterium marambiense]